MKNKKPLPLKEENPNGLHARYYIQKIVGVGKVGGETFGVPNTELILKETDEGSEYFILRLDDKGKDPKHIEACRKAVLYYANEIKDHLPELSKDLIERYFQEPPSINEHDDLSFIQCLYCKKSVDDCTC